MKSRYLLLILCLITVSLFAQEKEFTYEDVVINSYSSLRPTPLKNLKWVPESDNFSFITDNKLIMEDISGTQTTLLSLELLNVKLAANGIETLTSFPSVNWLDGNTFYFWKQNKLVEYNYSAKTLFVKFKLPSDAKNIKLNGNCTCVAYTISNNLFVMDSEGLSKQITFDEDPEILNGHYVHRREFGITNGIFWSPGNNYIAFYRKDESMVTNYPLVDYTTTPATLKNVKYPMAGQTSHHVQVGVYNLTNGKTTWLKTGEPLDQYLTSVNWGPEGKFIYIPHLNRDQNHLKMIKYDALTGEQVKILFEEKDKEYVEPETPIFFVKNQNDKFLWLSERDGWNHFYLYDTDGNLIKQLTKGNWPVIDFGGFDESGKKIFFSSNKKNVIDRDYYSVNMETCEVSRITENSGRHDILKNSTGKYLIDNFNSINTPLETRLIKPSGELVRVIKSEDNPIKDYKLGDVKFFSIKGENDVDLYCRMIYPPNFDETNKYPVIFYVYGGPHSQGVINEWPWGRYDFWFRKMAQLGYIVFEIDNRGTAHRGIEFEQATFGKLGTVELKDQLTGAEYLKTLPYIDHERFGVYGWSYGGFLTVTMMLRANDTFKVGVAGAPVIDWKYYEIMYGERYMDTPQTNPDGYAESSLLNYVENLNGKLLIVQGTSDETVVRQNSLEFVKRAININKQMDYFPYIGHPHGVRGKDTIHLYNKITDYFLQNL